MAKQPKVSMVMPCWNKIKYIGHMLESVYNQEWDNIELIMVNDGATDGSREVMEHWKNKMITDKGYEVIIIDQENQGICKAVYNGMLKITGEFFCCVDCDDELDPEYVSEMAGFLCENSDYDWVCCDTLQYKDTVSNRELTTIFKNNQPLDDPLLAFLLNITYRCTFLIMTRTAYLHKCKVIENYVINYNVNQEPGLFIPLAAGNGKLGYVGKPLYYHNLFNRVSHISAVDELMPDYYLYYGPLCYKLIAKLDMPANKKEFLFKAAALGALKDQIELAKKNPQKIKRLDELAREFADIFNSTVPANRIVTKDDVVFHGGRVYLQTAYHYYTNGIKSLGEMLAPLRRAKRIVGVGALGESALKRLPVLLENGIKPDILWDKGANPDSEIMGFTVTQPDYESLRPDDLVVIFTLKMSIAADIMRNTQDVRGKASFFMAEDIEGLYSAYLIQKE
jgi:glycosyltransferase involved in cell wall biosynthesis